MTVGIETVEFYRVQRLNLPEGGRTWTVLGRDPRVVEPAEEYLEYLRAQRSSPNTVKAYARGLALWWQYLSVFDLRWDAVKVADFGAFLTWLRTADEPGVTSIEQRPARFAESTISARLGAVMSCYDYHLLNGVDVGRDLHRIAHRGGSRYKPLLEHLARRHGRRRSTVKVREAGRGGPPPVLTPGQIALICDACAIWDAETGQWRESVRNRLLWMLRSCVAHILTASLRHARPETIVAFERLIAADDLILAADSLQRLMLYIGNVNPEIIDPVIQRMLGSQDSDAREAGGAISAVAALEWDRPELTNQALSGDAHVRKGFADV